MLHAHSTRGKKRSKNGGSGGNYGNVQNVDNGSKSSGCGHRLGMGGGSQTNQNAGSRPIPGKGVAS